MVVIKKIVANNDNNTASALALSHFSQEVREVQGAERLLLGCRIEFRMHGECYD